MILILASGIRPEERERLLEFASDHGYEPRLLSETLEGGRQLLMLSGGPEGPDPDGLDGIRLLPGVERVLDFTDALPRTTAASDTAAIDPFWSADEDDCFDFSPRSLIWIAGPCSVDNPEFLGEVATAAARAGASMLRGGAFKPRTSPYAFQGQGREGLLLLAAVARDLRLPFVTEVLDPRDVEFVAEHADMIQIGARNMQNQPLLREVGASGRPVMLKRGMAATMGELLASAEYLLDAGCTSLVLCERGVRNFDTSRRALLDLSIVPALRERTALPVLVDPSHATGRKSLVTPMAKAAVAAGADGIMIEAHPHPEQALSDGSQALLPAELAAMGKSLRALAALEGRRIPTSPLFREDLTEGATDESATAQTQSNNPQERPPRRSRTNP